MRSVLGPLVSVASALQMKTNGLRVVGESARFVVSGAVATTLVVNHDLHTCEWVVGAISAAALNKGLKRLIKQARPEGSVEVADDGMPSSHACAMTNIALSALDGQPWPYYVVAAAYVASSLAYRYVAKYHTIPQLLVGALVGGTTSIAWRHYKPLATFFAALDVSEPPVAFVSFALVAGALVVGSVERWDLTKKNS